MKVSIVIPAYNEEKRIGKTLEEFSKYFSKLKKEKKLDYEIVVVINNTKDKTEEIVLNYCNRNKEIICLNFKQGGKGFAIIEGFKNALTRKNDLVGFVDADLAISPEAYYDLIKNINGYDGIIASRYLKNSKVNPKQSLQRIIVSRIFNFWIKLLLFLNYKDTQCGAKLFTKKAIEKIIPELVITNWAFDVDLLYVAKKEKLKIKEHPTVWSDKEYSKINLKRAGPRMALSVVRLRLLYSRFKWLVKIYDKLPNWIKIHHLI